MGRVDHKLIDLDTPPDDSYSIITEKQGGGSMTVPGHLEQLLDQFPDKSRNYNTNIIQLVLQGMLRQAASDLRGLPSQNGDKKLSDRIINAVDAYEFFLSKTFFLICQALGVDMETMRIEIIRRTARGDLP